jgi:hypothetical protein
LPRLKGILWEPNRKGGWDCRLCPPGWTNRDRKPYLGHVGKRQLAAWLKAQPTKASLRPVVEAWVAQRRKEKGA